MKNKTRWDALSMRDRASLIRLYTKGGVLNLKQMKSHYNSFETGGYADGEDSLLWYNPEFDSTPTEELRLAAEAAVTAAREAEKRDVTTKKSKKTKQDKYNDELAKAIIASGDNTRNKYLGTPNDQPLQEEHPLAAVMIGGATGKLIGNIGLSGLGKGLANGIEWAGEKAMPSALMKGAATYLPETAGFVNTVAPWADAAALSYWSAQGANAAIDAAKRGDTLGAVGYGGLAGLPVTMPVVKNGLPWMSKVAKEAKSYIGALRDIKQNGLEIDIDLPPFGQMVEDANALDTFNRNMKRLNQFYAIGKRGEKAFPYFPNNPKLKYDLQRQYSRNLSDIYGMFVDDARSSGLSWQEVMSDPITTSLLSNKMFSPSTIASGIPTKAMLAKPNGIVYSFAQDRPRYLKNLLRTIQEKKKVLNEYAQAYYNKFGEWPQHMPSVDALYSRVVKASWAPPYNMTEEEAIKMIVDEIPRFDSLNPESGITYILSESPKTSSPLNVNQLRRSIRRGKDLFREGYSAGDKGSYYAESRYDRNSNAFNTADDIMQDANERAYKLSTRFERTYSDSEVKDKMRVAKYKAFSITRSSDNARLSSQKAKMLYKNTTDPALHQIYEENPEYLEYIARTGKDPLRQETVDDFIRLQSTAMRGVTGDSKDMTAIDRFLSDPKNYSGKTGGDRLGIGDRDYSGIYTSNSYGIADRFSRPQSGYADAFRGTLLYPFKETVNKDLPIRDQLLQLRSNVADWDLFVNDLGVNNRDLAKAGRRIGLLAVEGNYANRHGEILPANERGYLGKKNLTIVKEEVEPNAQNINGRWGYDLKASPRDEELFIPKMTSVGDLERIEEILKNVGDLKKDPVLYNEILTLTRQRLDKANALITGSKAYNAGKYVAVHKGDLIGDAVGVGAIGLMAIPATYGIKIAIANNKHRKVIDNMLYDLYGDTYPPKNENGEIDVAKEIQMRYAAESALMETLKDRQNKKALGGEITHKYNMGGDKDTMKNLAYRIGAYVHDGAGATPFGILKAVTSPQQNYDELKAYLWGPENAGFKPYTGTSTKPYLGDNIPTYNATINPDGQYVFPENMKGFIEEVANRNGNIYLNADLMPGSDKPRYDAANYPVNLFYDNNGNIAGNAADLYDFGINYSTHYKTPKWQIKAMRKQGTPYAVRQDNLPFVFSNSPEAENTVTAFSYGEMGNKNESDEAIINAMSRLGNGTIEPASITFEYPERLENYASGGKIHIKPENRGKFTALKKRTGKTASWFKAHGTPAQKKMATFALNAAKWHKK